MLVLIQRVGLAWGEMFVREVTLQDAHDVVSRGLVLGLLLQVEELGVGLVLGHVCLLFLGLHN